MSESLPLLRGVSRSFYLSIRILPAAVRAPIGTGYLLARATDTVADAPGLRAPERLALLDVLAEAFERGELPAAAASRLAGVAAGLPHAREAALLRNLPACLAAFSRLPPKDQADLRTLLRFITRGQRLDVQRFPEDGKVRALASQADTDAYTYLVAGSVGEFWTRLCERHLPAFAMRPSAEMLALGRSFGMGLQRVNILRDAGEDLARGRCYFPAERLTPMGLHPGSLASQAAAFQPVWDEWIRRTEAAMEDGMRYALALRNRRLRVACALPALVGTRTVALLRAAGPAALQERVKMPRSEMRSLLLGIALTFGGESHLRSAFARLRDNRSP